MHDHIGAGAAQPAPAIHYASHSPLLEEYTPSRRRRIDGIIVSTARPAWNLRAAFRLAAALSAPVVVLCSREAGRAGVIAEARTVSGLSWTAIDLHDWPDGILPHLQTSGFLQAKLDPHGDLSRKRNLGLLLARLVGWKRLLFLDDDISGLDVLQVEHAAAGLDHFAAVGMPARSYPDNSIVGHARRRTGAWQDVFVSGSALAVCEPATDSFFPDVYNEDWLFLAPHLDRREVTTLGSVAQLSYDPFEDPDEAGAQEFGDVLAEGLLAHLHTARLYPLPTRAYWAAFLEDRDRLLTSTHQRCRTEGFEDALPALQNARLTLARISADQLVDYVRAWQDDLATWRRWILDSPRLDGLGAALHYLHLAARTDSSDSPDEHPAARERPDRSLRDPARSRQACGE